MSRDFFEKIVKECKFLSCAKNRISLRKPPSAAEAKKGAPEGTPCPYRTDLRHTMSEICPFHMRSGRPEEDARLAQHFAMKTGIQTMPCATIASAILRKPAMFAPAT